MSRTEVSTFEPASAPAAVIAQGPPTGAVPQRPAPGSLDGPDGADPLRLDARSGDTDVVFRLERRLPFLGRLGDLGDRLDRLADYRQLLIAGGIGLVVVATLAFVLGGAYRKPLAPPPPAVATTPAPALAPPAVEPTPVAAPVAAAPVLTAVAPSPHEASPPAVRRAAPRAKAVAHRTPARAKKPRPRAR